MCGWSAGVRAKALARGWLKQARTVSNPSAARRRAFSIASRLLPAPAQPRMDARGLPWSVRRTLSCIWVGARSSCSPSSISLRSSARRTTSGSTTSQMTSTWVSVSVRSRLPSPLQKRITRSSAAAAASSVARSDRSRINSAGASGPRARPPWARLSRSVCGKATAWIGRSSPRQRGSASILSAIARADASACSNGGGSRCRLPAYQRPNPSRTMGPPLVSMTRTPIAGSTSSRSISPFLAGPPSRVGASQRTLAKQRAPSGRAARIRASTSRSARSPRSPKRCLLTPGAHGPSSGR